MHLIKEDVAKIKQYHDKAEATLTNIKETGDNAYNYFYEQLQHIRDNGNVNREEHLKVIGEYVKYCEMVEAMPEEDPETGFDITTLNTLAFDIERDLFIPKHELDIAYECVLMEELAENLPDNEVTPLERDKWPDVKFDQLPLKEQARKEIVDAKRTIVENKINELKQGKSAVEQVTTDLVFDNEAFRLIRQHEQEYQRINMGQMDADEMLKQFRASKEFVDYAIQNFEFTKGQDLVDSQKKCKDYAADQFSAYNILKQTKDRRTTFEKFTHPIRSLKEFFAEREMRNSLKSRYNLTDDNIKSISDIMNREQLINNIGLFERSNNVQHLLVASDAEIERMEEHILTREIQQLDEKTAELLNETDMIKSQEDLNKSLGEEFSNEVKKDNIEIKVENNNLEKVKSGPELNQ